MEKDILRLIEIWAPGQAVEKAKLGDGHRVPGLFIGPQNRQEDLEVVVK